MRAWGLLAALAAGAVCRTAAGQAEEMPPAPSDAEYQDFLHLGTRKLKIWADLKLQEWYDSNITLVNSGEKDDFITVIAPSVGTRWDYASDFVQFNYLGREMLYSRDHNFSGMEQFVDGLGHLRLGKFWTELREQYQIRRDPLDVTQANPRTDVVQNDTTLTTGLDFDKLDFEAYAGYRTFDVRTSSLSYFDHTRESAGALAAYDVMSKTQALVEVGWTSTAFDQAVVSDWTSERILVGLRGTPAAKVRLTAKTGYDMIRTKDNGSIASHDVNAYYLGAALDWDSSANGMASLKVFRQPVESIFTGVAISTRVDASYRHDVGERIVLAAALYYEMLNEVASTTLDRSIYGASAGATYKYDRHFAFEVWGEYRAKSASIASLEFSDLRAYVGASAGF